ncbi:hypothetical protein K3N62_03600 [Streptococcus dysgalactiae subsp. dysgalactiae]|uniref:hypothetical protein n=1 Tax=Streptococcus dysgalactiae TaxID=1334 RepID=UPI001CF1D868|nr:hypothetical protein [Streptococcus dysgalactiae]MCB2846577.1 hypothetical protein [Streptococcus dysgalactiae subsp. dysgalactiae]
MQSASQATAFREKIAQLRLFDQNSMQEMPVEGTIDLVPSTVTLVAEISLFNVIPNKDYLVFVKVKTETSESDILVHATKVNLPKGNFFSIDSDGFGNATGNFSFNFTITKDKNYQISFQLLDASQDKIYDEHKQYFRFVVR